MADHAAAAGDAPHPQDAGGRKNTSRAPVDGRDDRANSAARPLRATATTCQSHSSAEGVGEQGHER